MPRTKAQKSKATFCPLTKTKQDLVEEFKRMVDQEKIILEQSAKDTIRQLDNAYITILAELHEDDLNKTVGQMREENHQRELMKSQHLKIPGVSHSTVKLSASSQKDDGYVTEATARTTPSTSGDGSELLSKTVRRPSRRLSRSLSRSNVKGGSINTTTSSKSSLMAPPSTLYRSRKGRSSSASAVSRPAYKTPASHRMANFPPITPKQDRGMFLNDAHVNKTTGYLTPSTLHPNVHYRTPYTTNLPKVNPTMTHGMLNIPPSTISRAMYKTPSTNRSFDFPSITPKMTHGMLNIPLSTISRAMYKTPSTNRSFDFPSVTPKVAPNTPMAVLRRPREGEMIMSLSGSPLLPGSSGGVNQMPNCNIPLIDGTVLAVAPHKMRKSQIELPLQYMGPEMIEHLNTLRNNLNFVCQMVQKKP